MKTRIQKIILIAAALIFVGSGISFAHEWNDRNHKPPGKANGYYQVKKLPAGWTNKNPKSQFPITKRYAVYSGQWNWGRTTVNARQLVIYPKNNSFFGLNDSFGTKRAV